MKFHAISAILLVILAFVGVPSASGVKVIFDRGFMLLEAGKKESFDYQYWKPKLGLYITDEHNHGGQVVIGDLMHQDVNVEQMSFVVETVASDYWPPTPRDEDQIWYRESDQDLLKSVSWMADKIRIRKLNNREKILVDKYTKPQQNPFEKYRIIIEDGFLIAQTTLWSGLNSLGHFQPTSSEFTITGMENDRLLSAYISPYQGRTFVIDGSRTPVNCKETVATDVEYYCEGNFKLTEL